MVYERAAGLTEADRAKVTADAQAFAQRPDLDGPIVGPTFAENGAAAQVIVPLLLIGTVVLSFAAALGVSALVFTYLFGFDSSDSSFPLFVFVFVVSLGIDYNIFLMTRVREEALRHGTRPATLTGLAATGGAITSAGLVLAGTFAVLTTLPLVQLAQMGFAVAFGILLDTIIVRSLVTALSLDIGRYMWRPSRLFRKADEPMPAG